MTRDKLKIDKFSEELYFLLMSPSIRQRVWNLASKYDITHKQLRDGILSHAISAATCDDINSEADKKDCTITN